jgi:hypothetical protein
MTTPSDNVMSTESEVIPARGAQENRTMDKMIADMLFMKVSMG